MEQRLARDQAASYQIQVQGQVGERWAGYLGGLSMSVAGEPKLAVTTLSGQFMDQAALIGALNTLYDLGFSLLSVEYCPPPGRGVSGD